MSLSIGPFALSWTHIIFFTAYFIALIVGWGIGRRRKVSIEPVLTKMLIVGLIFARIIFVARYWAEYSVDVLSIIDIRDGGFSLAGGIVGSLLVAGYSVWRQPQLRLTLISAVSAAAVVWIITTGIYDKTTASRLVPQLEYKTLTAEPTTLAQFSGKPMVINLWATWCPPCRREMPVFMQAQHTRTDVHVVFINQGELEHSINSFLKAENLTLSNMLLDYNQSTMRQLGAQGLPTTLFYNAEGVLIQAHMGELSRASLNHALKKIAPQ